MKSYECPNCGNLMDEGERRCKYCGSANPNYSGPRYNPQPAAVNAPQNAQSSTPVKKEKEKMNVLVFILLLIFFWPGAIIYAIVCVAK